MFRNLNININQANLRKRLFLVGVQISMKEYKVSNGFLKKICMNEKKEKLPNKNIPGQGYCWPLITNLLHACFPEGPGPLKV